jgi:hypothetical protein
MTQTTNSNPVARSWYLFTQMGEFDDTSPEGNDYYGF